MIHQRKTIRIALVLAAVLVTACTPQPGLVGMWTGMYQGDEVSMAFDDKGQVVVSSNGQSSTATYTADFSSKPHKLDIELEGSGKVETIFEFVDAKTLRLQNNVPGQPRPTEFDEDAITLAKE